MSRPEVGTGPRHAAVAAAVARVDRIPPETRARIVEVVLDRLDGFDIPPAGVASDLWPILADEFPQVSTAQIMRAVRRGVAAVTGVAESRGDES